MSELRIYRDHTGRLTAGLHDIELGHELPVLILHDVHDDHGYYGDFGNTLRENLAANLRGIGEAALHAAGALESEGEEAFERLFAILSRPQAALAELRRAGGNAATEDRLLSVSAAPKGAPDAWMAVTEDVQHEVSAQYHPRLSVAIGGAYKRVHLGINDESTSFDIYDPRDAQEARP